MARLPEIRHIERMKEALRKTFGHLAATTIERFGHVDVLVANAGVNLFSGPLSLSEAEWRHCFSAHLDGLWFSVRSVLPSMLGQRTGSIVVMASCHSFGIIPNCFPYPVAKHRVVGLVRALAVQYASQGIRVNAIAPGYVESELAQQYWTTFHSPEKERARICRLHPAGRLRHPSDVAVTAVFLASDEAPFINATTIQIDGSRSAVYHDECLQQSRGNRLRLGTLLILRCRWIGC